MNLYFRLIRIMLKSLFASRLGVMDQSRISYRVWPFDCDINLHLTNSRYFGLCDLARTWYMGELGILYKAIGRKWIPVVQAQEITYFKSVPPFRRFDVTTRLLWWDEKYWYIEHRFEMGDRLCAILQVRGVFMCGRTIIPSRDMLSLAGAEFTPPEKPATVAAWQQLLDSRKR